MRREEDSLRGRLFEDRDGSSRLNLSKIFGPPGCQAACPIGQDVRAYMRLIFEGRYREALEVIRDANPLPSVCGYVCHHPCERACMRGKVDDPLAIRSLKQFVADHDDGNLTLPARETLKDQKVAIIGSGPAALAAAYELAKKGYDVEITESHKDPGGMLAWAIPAFRLPRAALERDIDCIRKMGVKIRTGLSFGRDVTVDSLRKQGLNAVILATGTQKSLKMNIRDENGVPGYLDCLTFLRKYSDGEAPHPGNRVLVVGGGNAAVDTARVALRLGAGKVRLVYRRSMEEMPADREEIEDAVGEGIEIMVLTAPVRLLVAGGKAGGLECVQTRLGEPDATGRRRPIPVENSWFEIPADTVISAVGQQQDFSTVSKGLSLAEGRVKVAPESMQTQVEGVFAAGDFVNGPTTVVEAMASGKKVARAVDAYLKEKDH
jgi:NADPH-dependent glutamate synthase beta subunit-like oxidoreductase